MEEGSVEVGGVRATAGSEVGRHDDGTGAHRG